MKQKQKLPGYLTLLGQLHQSPLRKLAATLESWLEPIVAMWRFSKSKRATHLDRLALVLVELGGVETAQRVFRVPEGV